MHMKKNLVMSGVLVALLVQTATATVVSYTDTWTVGQAIPDANPAGAVFSQTISGQYNGLGDSGITGVSVSLNLSGGYNGDLYGYLVFQSSDSSTTSAILLDRIGPGTYGNSGSSINVTLSSTGGLGDIGAVGATGNVTGAYTPDGNAAALDGFNGHNANGTWTLFLADLSGGDVSTLVSWGLEVSVVPEPATWALLGFGVLVGGSWVVTYRRKQTTI